MADTLCGAVKGGLPLLSSVFRARPETNTAAPPLHETTHHHNNNVNEQVSNRGKRRGERKEERKMLQPATGILLLCLLVFCLLEAPLLSKEWQWM